MKKIERIGFIGLGKMGTPMARRLLKAKFPLIVYDKNQERIKPLEREGAIPANSIRETAAKADVIISVLSRPSATEEVVLGKDGVIEELGEGKIFIDMSTSSLALTLKICEKIEGKYGEMLDAPVSGGVKGAEKGTLTFIIGGRKETFNKCKTIFYALGKNVHYAGKTGNGMLLKLLNNLLYSINMCAAAEVLTLGEKMGLEISDMVEVFKDASASSYCIHEKVPSFVIPGEYDSGFSTELLLKDIELAMEMGGKTGTMQIFSKLSHDFFTAALSSGIGEMDNSSVIEVFRNSS